MRHKPRSLRRQRALNRHHRRAARAARQANRGLYHTMTGEDKWGHEKRAFKRHFDALAISTSFDAILLKSTAQTPVRPRILPEWSEWRKRAA